VDDDVVRVLRSLRRRPGPTELLAYRNGTGWVDVRSDEINAYIREHGRGPFSAKDFRTWHASVLAALAVAVLGRDVRSETGRRRVVLQASREVSRYLGNTPAVCRNSYIDPRVFEHFYDGETIAVDLEALADDDRVPADELKDAESAVVDLLSHDPAR
jgi:DNA topoisomerase IB